MPLCVIQSDHTVFLHYSFISCIVSITIDSNSLIGLFAIIMHFRELRSSLLLLQLSGEGVYQTSALSFISLFKCWGRRTPGVLSLNLLCNSSFKDPWKVIIKYLVSGTRENDTDPVCVRELVCLCVNENECSHVRAGMCEMNACGRGRTDRHL